MAAIHSDEFKRDAVRIALTSGLTRRQVVSDLGIGLSTLGKWVRAISEEARVPEQDADLLRENERLCKENRILREEREVLKKSGNVLCSSKAMRFQYIAGYRGPLLRGHLCRLMGVSERGLYAWQHRPPSQRKPRDMVLLAHIRDQHRLSLGSYGRPRITEELNELGIHAGQRRVGRLMRENGIRVIRSNKFKRTTDSDHAFAIAPNLLQMAVANCRPPSGCVHHTDRGSQYCAHDYQKLLKKHGFKPSMSGKGNCYDNSAVESFFKSLKAELIWQRTWQSRREVEIAVFDYINGFYNPRRKHSTLGWKSPVAFEKWAA